MARNLSRVYKITINPGISIASDRFSMRPPPALHGLQCTFCQLDRWDHVGLSSAHWRWYWNDQPGAWIEYKGEKIELRPSCVVLVPPNLAFATHTQRPVGHLYCHFWLGVHPTGGDVRPCAVNIDRQARAALAAIARAARRSAPSPSSLPTLWLSVLSHVARDLSAAPYTWEAGESDPLIERVRHRLYADASTAWARNASLAADVGLSVNTLLRRFRRATGTTPKKLQMQLRLERAASLLRDGSLPIDDIATQCGFVDRYHLSRVFKAHAGIGPATFRRASVAG